MTASASAAAPPRSRLATTLLVTNAAVAWIGVAISLTLAVTGNNKHLDPANPTQIGNLASGVETPLERFFDWLSYFTIWSNVLVAVVVTVLVTRPVLFARTDRVGTVWRALRLDSVLMIVVTGIVYNLLLAKGGLTGWPLVSNTFVHVITPILTTLVWLIAGPRGLMSHRVIFGALVVPVVYVVWALVRGAAIGAYPYPFLDVAVKGYPYVLAFVCGLIAFAVLLAYVLWAVDTGLGRLTRPRAR
jgi:hypothetical protein